MQNPTPPDANSPQIFDHQQIAYRKLRTSGHICFSPHRINLPLQPRTNSLLIGPSGSGKSYLARAVAESFGLECKSLTVAEWMLLGTTSRGTQRTWNSIFDFLVKNHSKNGAVIFLDEIDKLTGASDWVQHLRIEVFRLLDLSVPGDLVDSYDDRIDSKTFEAAENFLKTRTLIIAAGAFQHFWESADKRIGGFGGFSQVESPTLEVLTRHLPTEIVNRFRSDVAILAPLRAHDYESMLLASAEKMPIHLQERFLNLGEQRIHLAVHNNQGVRFIEELIGDVIADEHTEPIQREPTARQASRWRLGLPINQVPSFVRFTG